MKKQYPNQLLAYNCSPSFNWKKNLDDTTIGKFQRTSRDGYKYQFITLAGIHNMWYNMFDLTQNYLQDGMTATLILFKKKSSSPFERIYILNHQQEVGAGYFDEVTTVIQGGSSSVTALKGSTEENNSSKKT